MKSNKLSFDLSDHPDLVELLRLESSRKRIPQKGILVEALQAYFGNRLENLLVSRVAEEAFKDWDNKEDEIYNDL